MKPPPAFRAASYNIRKCVGRDRRRDPARILDIIKDLNADVVALQEADLRLGKRPTAIPHDIIIEKTGMDFVPLSENPASLGWHGNAVFLRQGLNVSGFERIDLPALEPRGAVLVEWMHADTPVRLVAAHLGLVRRHRIKQLAAIKNLISNRPAMPTLVAGDFNEWSRTKGTEPIANEFEIYAPGPSFHTARPIVPLDRIALGKGLQLHDGGVWDTPQTRIASDHLPIWADIKVTGNEADLETGEMASQKIRPYDNAQQPLPEAQL